MNPLALLKEKLAIKPTVEKRERVFVVIKEPKGTIKSKTKKKW